MAANDGAATRRAMTIQEICNTVHDFVAAAQASDKKVFVYGNGVTPRPEEPTLTRTETLHSIQCVPVVDRASAANEQQCIKCMLSTREGGARSITLYPDSLGNDRARGERLWVHSDNLDDLNIVAQTRWERCNTPLH